jgi:hypothetical protein
VLLPRKYTAVGRRNDVSLHGEQPLEHGVLRILVEKDFTCVEPRDGEDQSDLYPNPKAPINAPEN